MDGSSLASWDTAEQSNVTWSEVMIEPCLERLPLALPQTTTKGNLPNFSLPQKRSKDNSVLVPTTPTNNPPLCAFPPLDQLNTKVCSTNIEHSMWTEESVCVLHFSWMNIGDYFQGYWTPPEDECDIPTLPSFDPKLLANAPPELLRGSRQSMVRIFNDNPAKPSLLIPYLSTH